MFKHGSLQSALQVRMLPVTRAGVCEAASAEKTGGIMTTPSKLDEGQFGWCRHAVVVNRCLYRMNVYVYFDRVKVPFEQLEICWDKWQICNV